MPFVAWSPICEQPVDAAAQSRFVRSDAQFGGDDHGESGAVAVICFRVEGLAVTCSKTFSVRQQTGG